MIMILDTSKSWRAERLRNAIRRAELPCAIADPGELLLYQMPFAVVIFSDMINMLQDMISTLDGERFLVANIDNKPKNETEVNIEIARIIDRILDLLDVKYGFVPQSMYSGRISIMSGIVRYAGRRIYLTDAELLIVLYLITKRGQWTSAQELMVFCLDEDSGSVPVHICRINRKTEYISPVRMIRTQRGNGYMLS